MKYHTITTDENNKIVLDEVKETFAHASPDNDDDLRGHWSVIYKGSLWKLLQAWGPQLLGLFSKLVGGAKS